MTFFKINYLGPYGPENPQKNKILWVYVFWFTKFISEKLKESNNFNELASTIKLNKYSSSMLYKQLVSKNTNKLDDEAHIIFIKKIINSFENFKAYIESNNYIDYTYLWDIICKSNDLLFPNGLNLIILDKKFHI